MTTNLDLFGMPADAPAQDDPAGAARPPRGKPIQPAALSAELAAELSALAVRLPRQLYLGTSSWSYPGWHGLVYDGQYTESLLSRKGLTAYGQHPLLRAAGIDRGFYGPIPLADYLSYASQVPEDFRFLIKAPASVCDGWVRGADGAGRVPNAAFLDPDIAVRDFIVPATGGLGRRCGPLLFQLSPLGSMAHDAEAFHARLAAFLEALPPLDPTLTPSACYAVEMRDPALLTPRYIKLLRAHGVRFCLSARDRLPPVSRQAGAQALMDAEGPGPLVVRWMLYQGRSYEIAEAAYAPFDKLVDEDVPTREAIADLVVRTLAADQPAYVIVSNKAEGSAPLTCVKLAQAIADRLRV
ncbi:uncharacterized protein YecE (DUF72 family) [Cupriavidus plantarum]|nr:DUF72 domain-containing protein [Cupriavidus plantarum]NYH98146.1 uncharacterized protein YecE (DUF72 family) [Cupriavidus plantarum]